MHMYSEIFVSEWKIIHLCHSLIMSLIHYTHLWVAISYDLYMNRYTFQKTCIHKYGGFDIIS